MGSYVPLLPFLFPFCRVLLVGLTKSFLLERRTGRSNARPPTALGVGRQGQSHHLRLDLLLLTRGYEGHPCRVQETWSWGCAGCCGGFERRLWPRERDGIEGAFVSFFFSLSLSYSPRLERVWLTDRHLYSTVCVCQGCFIRPCRFGTFSRQTSSRSSPTFIWRWGTTPSPYPLSSFPELRTRFGSARRG